MCAGAVLGTYQLKENQMIFSDTTQLVSFDCAEKEVKSTFGIAGC
jgi:hypothetical protein